MTDKNKRAIFIGLHSLTLPTHNLINGGSDLCIYVSGNDLKQ